MNFQKIFESRILKTIIYSLAIIILAILIFQAGVFVGYRKAAFSYQWGENYYRAFGDTGRKPMMGGFVLDGLTGAHGVAGKIMKVSLPNFIIEGQDKIEKMIFIKDDTVINRSRDSIKSSELQAGDFVIVIGSPDDEGKIQANLIRLAPPPEFFNDTTTRPR